MAQPDGQRPSAPPYWQRKAESDATTPASGERRRDNNQYCPRVNGCRRLVGMGAAVQHEGSGCFEAMGQHQDWRK